MTWNPTHVQFTVLRARNLPTKGKGGAKMNDVFVTIQLGKEKFQTSTIKNAVNPEWFEQCDLTIPHLNSEIQVHVMHRGMLTDDFIGYTAVPLTDYKLYERPRSQWCKLQCKPSKPPDNKYRGDLEVRVLFQVKSKAEETMSSSVKKSSKSPSLKALTNIGHKVGDKFGKLTRSRSFRESRSPESGKHGNGTVQRQMHTEEGFFALTGVESTTGNTDHLQSQRAPQSSPSDNSSFPAIDIVPPDWDDTQANPQMSRSISMSNHVHGSRDDSTLGNYNLQRAGNRQSLPPSYFETQTLPRPRGKRMGITEDMRQRETHQSAGDLDTSRSSQPNYLDSMFKKEREVFRSMQLQRDDSSNESDDAKTRPRKCAKEYVEAQEESSNSDSEDSNEISLPEVRRKESINSTTNEADMNNSSPMNNLSPVISEEPSKEGNSSDEKDVTETHFPEFSAETVSPDNRADSTKEAIVSKEDENETPQKELVAPPRHKKKIAPAQNFTFGQSPEKAESQGPDSNVRRRSKRERDRLHNQMYRLGGRRYTVQGLDYMQRNSSWIENLSELRPCYPQEMSVPQDLISIYRNMTKEELIHLVIQHKAQLIRKEQYMKDMEEYIDDLLVRVMETSPRLLQTSMPQHRRQWRPF